jgi:hypothetical protein
VALRRDEDAADGSGHAQAHDEGGHGTLQNDPLTFDHESPMIWQSVLLDRAAQLCARPLNGVQVRLYREAWTVAFVCFGHRFSLISGAEPNLQLDRLII